MLQDAARFRKMVQHGWGKIVEFGVRLCKMLQDVAIWCKMVQDDARWYKMVQDGIRWCKMVQDGA